MTEGQTTESAAPTVEEMLEHRHEWKLLWVEPWQACGPEGNDLDAHVEIRATIHDCINMSRRIRRAHGHPTAGDDAGMLLDFMAVHWATLEK